MSNKIKCNCWVCGGGEIRPLFSIDRIPIFCNVQYTTAAEARQAPTGMLALQYCTRCGFLFNGAFDPDAVAYMPAYENALHFSPHFQRFAGQLADELIATYALHGKHVVDVGCGKGDFLRLLCTRGGNTGTGYDPSYTPANAQGEDEPFTVVPSLFGQAYAGQPADFLCCRHVLEHIPTPIPFLLMIREALADRPRTPVYFEVPNADYMFSEGAIWDLIYEHCGYFGEASLRHAFQRAGFVEIRTRTAFGDQYLCIEARIGDADPQVQPPRVQAVPDAVAQFSACFTEKIETWQAQVDRSKAAEQRVVIWGAGSKGVTLSNLLDLASYIPYLVDVNPRKQGRFVAGTGQEIVSPSFLKSYAPDVVILTNPRYTKEISAELEAMDLHPTLWCG